jgi:hypothetical protein
VFHGAAAGISLGGTAALGTSFLAASARGATLISAGGLPMGSGGLLSPGLAVEVRRIRDYLLQPLLPHVRFPLIGAAAFARTVVPRDALSGESTTALLMSFIVPQLPVPYSTARRVQPGSVVSWSPEVTGSVFRGGRCRTVVAPPPTLTADATVSPPEAGANTTQTGSRNAHLLVNAQSIVALSEDARTVHFRKLPGASEAEGTPDRTAAAEAAFGISRQSPLFPDALLVSEQTFSAGSQTIYITVWGVTSAYVGLAVSRSDSDVGDSAVDALAAAGPWSTQFEGVFFDGTGSGEIHSCTRAASMNTLGYAPLRDGYTIAVSIDCDEKAMVISVIPKGAPGALPIAKLSHLPPQAARLVFAPQAAASSGDVDGVVSISSQSPIGALPVAGQAKAAVSTLFGAPAKTIATAAVAMTRLQSP